MTKWHEIWNKKDRVENIILETLIKADGFDVGAGSFTLENWKEYTKELFDSLNKENIFKMTEEETKELQKYFSATFSDDNFGLKTIKEFLDSGYLMDPHTATCIKAYNDLREKPLKTVIYSTAEWTKFSPTVLNALKQDSKKYSDKEALEEISTKFGANLPKSIKNLFNAKINHSLVINKENIESEIIKFIRKS